MLERNFVLAITRQSIQSHAVSQFYTYILTNARNTVLYTGISNDLVRRVQEHRSSGSDTFCGRYAVHKLVYFEAFSSALDAIGREKQIKKYSRAKKKALVDGFNPEWDDLSVISIGMPTSLCSSA